MSYSSVNGTVYAGQVAIEWSNRALAADPDDPTAMLCRGFSLSNKGEDEAAIEWYDKALALSPDDRDALVSKGVSLSKLGRPLCW
ncbi:MAG: tetratricopeptide repeat protein [Armatimonadota bacterium]